MYKLINLITYLLVPHTNGRAGGDGGAQRRRLAHLGPHDGDIWKQSWRVNSKYNRDRSSLCRGGQKDNQYVGCVILHPCRGDEFKQHRAHRCYYHVRHSSPILRVFFKKLSLRLHEFPPRGPAFMAIFVQSEGMRVAHRVKNCQLLRKIFEQGGFP